MAGRFTPLALGRVLVASLLLYCVVGNHTGDDCRERLPNGYRIPFLENAPGYCADVTNGPKKGFCHGGAVTLNGNPFGKDFVAAGSKWTKKLCSRDSDGDGLTNGEELGDPCCIWRENAEMPQWMKDWPVSHPGYTNSTSNSAQSVDIAALCKEVSPLEAMSPYDEGEEITTLDYTFNHVAWKEKAESSGDTLFFENFLFNFPMNASYDIVGIDRTFDDEKDLESLMQYEVAFCPNTTEREGLSTDPDSFGIPCHERLYNWKVGTKSRFILPKMTGFRVGRGTGRLAFIAKLVFRITPGHEINSNTSTLTFHVTAAERPRQSLLQNHTNQGAYRYVQLSTVRMGFSVRPELIKEDSYVAVSSVVQLKVNDLVAPKGAKLVGYVPGHSQHFQTCKTWTERLNRTMGSRQLLRSLNELEKGGDLGRGIEWFDDGRNMTLNTGDFVSSTCVYSSVNAATSTEMERCHVTLFYYPAGALDPVMRWSGPGYINHLPQEEADSLSSVTQLFSLPTFDTRLPLWRELFLSGVYRCNAGLFLGGLNSTQLTPGVTDALFQLRSLCQRGDGLGGFKVRRGRHDFECSEECGVLMYNMMGCALVRDSKLEDGMTLSLFPAPVEGTAGSVCGQVFANVYEDYKQGLNRDLGLQYGLFSITNASKMNGYRVLSSMLATLLGIITSLC